MKTNWNYPTSLWVGENRVKDLTLACQNLKIKKPLFVTDKDLINLPIVKNIISELENSFNQINILTFIFIAFACNKQMELLILFI